jgi:hypothetical protein
MPINWVPLLGHVEIIDDRIKYIATTISEGPSAGQPQAAVVKSNIQFQNGEISFQVTLSESKDACQVILNHDSPPQIFVGVRSGGFSIARLHDNKWDFRGISGTGDLPKGQPIAIRVQVRGSQILLFVNDVKVCSALLESIQESQLALFLQGSSDFVVRGFVATVRRPKAFIVMQFADQFNALYDDVIKPTCEKYGFEVVRADDIYKCGLIIQDIALSIREASFVIADITPDNPNVFYEVGYAHGIGKTTILLSDRRRDKLPFDVSGFRTLFYDNTIGGKKGVEEALIKHIESLTAV